MVIKIKITLCPVAHETHIIRNSCERKDKQYEEQSKTKRYTLKIETQDPLVIFQTLNICLLGVSSFG